jgi:hypothetical protein
LKIETAGANALSFILNDKMQDFLSWWLRFESRAVQLVIYWSWMIIYSTKTLKKLAINEDTKAVRLRNLG